MIPQEADIAPDLNDQIDLIIQDIESKSQALTCTTISEQQFEIVGELKKLHKELKQLRYYSAQ